MSLWLKFRRVDREIEQLAGETARRSQAEVALVLGPRVRRMGLAEARGYIRARSTPTLKRHLQIMLRDLGASKHPHRPAILARAAEMLVQQQMGVLVRHSVAVAPRRAA